MTATITQWIAKVRKALLAAAAVITVLLTVEGVPSEWKTWLASILGVLATYGIVYEVPNKQPAEPVAEYTGGEV